MSAQLQADNLVECGGTEKRSKPHKKAGRYRRFESKSGACEARVFSVHPSCLTSGNALYACSVQKSLILATSAYLICSLHAILLYKARLLARLLASLLKAIPLVSYVHGQAHSFWINVSSSTSAIEKIVLVTSNIMNRTHHAIGNAK